jgi:hypothetical protein
MRKVTFSPLSPQDTHYFSKLYTLPATQYAGTAATNQVVNTIRMAVARAKTAALFAPNSPNVVIYSKTLQAIRDAACDGDVREKKLQDK